jgi:uncharacterized protein (TIGR04255 family)
LKLQYGNHNPDFPAPIKKPVFTLDIDGVANGSQDKTELLQNLDSIHARIQDLFERSITDTLRGTMNAAR